MNTKLLHEIRDDQFTELTQQSIALDETGFIYSKSLNERVGKRLQVKLGKTAAEMEAVVAALFLSL